jgi:acyl carrier protein
MNAESVVRDAWLSCLGINSLSPDDTFFGLGGDSLSAIEVMERVETALGIEFPLDTLFTIGTFSVVAGECAALYEATPEAARDNA